MEYLKLKTTTMSLTSNLFRYSERRDVTKLRKRVNYILRGIKDMVAQDLNLMSLVESNLLKISNRLKFDFLVPLQSITCDDEETIRKGVNNNPMIIAVLAKFNPQ
jgi:hypothetical protein